MTQAILAAGNALHIHALLDFFRDLKRSYSKRQRINATIKELSKLTDHELNDIGIARGDIWSIAHDDADYKQVAETNKNLGGWV